MDKSIVKRRKIAFLFLYTHKQWTGGIIYILNIISALNTLEDSEKPEIIILHVPNAPIADIQSLEYPYVKFNEVDNQNNFLKKVINRTSILLFEKSIYYNLLPDVVYPYDSTYCSGKNPIFWIPDFQEWYLPQMFTEADVLQRKKAQLEISKSHGIVVFSSKDAMHDFEKFYPDHNCDLRLLRFSCTLPKFKHLAINDLKQKFNITNNYFMSPNQFWKHKNHKVVLEAIVALKDKKLNFQVVFTGSESDYRNKEYFNTLKNYIAEHEIQSWVRFLGFIDRSEQLKLMDESIAIIQPSFFEGWSTVVEDAKALSQFILLSNIKVHTEQISENCMFFDPSSYLDLASQIESMVLNSPLRKSIDYTQNISSFAKNILEVLNI